MSAGNCGKRGANPGWAYGRGGVVPGAVGLVGGTEAARSREARVTVKKLLARLPAGHRALDPSGRQPSLSNSTRSSSRMLHLRAPCGGVRNAAIPWSYWNDSPRFSCGSVPLPRPSPSNHENDLSQLDFFAPSGAVARCVPVRGLGDTYPTNSWLFPPMLHPFRDSNPTYMLLFLPIHPAG